jgi:hypothetical protein
VSDHFPFLHHPSLEPFLDQMQDAAVGDAVLDELDHPRFVEIIEEALDVGIKHIVLHLQHCMDYGCPPRSAIRRIAAVFTSF